MSGEIYANKGLKCVHCKVDFPKQMSMKYGKGGKLAKGMIMVCSSCGGAMVLGDTEWRPMTKSDFDKLPHEAKLSLVMVVNQLKSKLKAGVEWSPYTKN